MRTAIRLGIGIGIAAASLSACKWTEFDDLQNETWVLSTDKPDVKSSDYGVAIQRGTQGGATGTGGTLVVIGAGQPTISQLTYSAKGDATLASGNTLQLDSQYGIGTLDPQPILLADPTSNDVSLIVGSGQSSVVVLTGSGQMTERQLFISSNEVDAATYMQPPPFNAVAQSVEPLVASGAIVAGTFFNTTVTPQPTCTLTDAATPIMPRGLGAVPGAASDDVIAWGANGKLYKYPGTVFGGCATQEPIGAGVATGLSPGKGAQILRLDNTHVVLQGHADASTDSLLAIFDTQTMTAVGAPITKKGLRQAAILTVGSATYVVAGYPTEVVDGKNGGVVILYQVTPTGFADAPALTLNDAQPDSDESFGRAVAVMPFNGTQLIAVAADNEIFMYFRANLGNGMPLYPETRQGR